MKEERKKLIRIVFFAALAMVSGLTFCIPFIFESMTLWYKIEFDKTLLQAAQLCGLCGLLLLCLQLMVAVRPPLLAKGFGAAALLGFHRANGGIILGAASAHILLVLWPEDLKNLPIGYDYWPEMVGVFLFIIVTLMFVTSRFRERLHLGYSQWRRFHKPCGYIGIVLVFLHVRFVCDSYQKVVPQIWLFFLLSLVMAAIFLGKRLKV